MMIKVFRLGVGTGVKYDDDGKQTLITGDGTFLQPSFSSKAEAAHFCKELLKEDPEAVYYLMDGDQIVESESNNLNRNTLTPTTYASPEVLSALHKKRDGDLKKRWGKTFERFIWTTFFGLFALMIDCTAFYHFSVPFKLGFIYAFETFSYLIYLGFMGLEALIIMFIVTVLTLEVGLSFVVHH